MNRDLNTAVERGSRASGFAALNVATHRDEFGREPTYDVEPVAHMADVG